MDESQKLRLNNLLTPLFACSVEQRYEILYSTSFGKRHFSTLNIQGAISNAISSVEEMLRLAGGTEEFLVQLEKMPVPDWYKG